MSHWNHRVIKHVTDNETYYTIEEVYYNDDDSPRFHTENLRLFGESIDELRVTLKRMLKCLDQPVVDEIEYEPNTTIEYPIEE